MKLHTLIPGIVFTLMLSAAASDSAGALQTFSTYEQGKPLAVLIDTRRAVFHGTTDEAVRTQREKELLAFLASDAHTQAKVIAIDWLGCLGSAACVPALTEAGKDRALAAAVAAAIERIQGPAAPAGNQPATPATDDHIATSLRSNNDLLAGAALRHIRAGAGSPALAAKLLSATEQKWI